MSSLNELGITILGSASINMQNAAGAQTIFTVPVGKTAYVTHVVIQNPSATLAGGTDFDFTSWRQTVDLSGFTTGANDYRLLVATDNTTFTKLTAGTNFQITPSTGSTGAATATVKAFGYLV